MKACRFCQAQIENATTVCFHCGRDQVSGREWNAAPVTVSATTHQPVAQQPEGATKPIAEPLHDPSIVRVSVVDANMPFGSMVGFMVKWALAVIPALLILFAITLLAPLLLALLGVFSRVRP